MSLLARLLAALGWREVPSANAQSSKIVRDVKAAAEWIAKALRSSGYNADFSVESLKEIDRFFDDEAPGGVPRETGLLSESLGARIFGIGSYVGEVVRRAAGGEWVGNDGDPTAEINVELHLKDGAILWPVQRAMKRLKNGREDGIYAYGHALLHP